MKPARPSPWPAHCRAALAQAIGLAARQFPRPGEDEATRVHDLRKTLKGAAGLARLFTEMVGPPAYAALTTIDGARKAVGLARDLDVAPKVLVKLDVPAAIQAALLAAIAGERESARRAHGAIDAAGFAAELAALAQEVAAWDVDQAGAGPLLAAARNAYRAAKKRGEAAFASREADALHAFRGKVVDLAFQLSAFEPAWPAMTRAWAGELHRLRGALGDHNDLTVLAEFARSRPELPPAEAEAILKLVAKKQRPLERRAERLYARLFAEKPADFERRLAAYLDHPRLKPRVKLARAPAPP